MVIFTFAFDLRTSNATLLAPGILWVAFLFASTVGLFLSNLEKEVDAEPAAFDNEVDETLDQMARDLVGAADALDAEMDAAAARLVALKAQASADVDVSVAEVKRNVDGFKAKIDAKRKDA